MEGQYSVLHNKIGLKNTFSLPRLNDSILFGIMKSDYLLLLAYMVSLTQKEGQYSAWHYIQNLIIQYFQFT